MAVVAAAAASGYIAGDWQRSRLALAEQKALTEEAQSLGSKLVEAERRLTDAQSRQSRSRDQAREAVEKSDLANCPLPHDVSELLASQVLAARSGGLGGPLSDRSIAMPRPGVKNVRGRNTATIPE